MTYEELTQAVIASVEDIMRMGRTSKGIKISIDIPLGAIPTVTYEICEQLIGAKEK